MRCEWWKNQNAIASIPLQVQLYYSVSDCLYEKLGEKEVSVEGCINQTKVYNEA